MGPTGRTAATFLSVVAVTYLASVVGSAQPGVLRAVAEVHGAPGSGIAGEVFFTQAAGGILPGVRVIAEVRGLVPNSVHGFHLHEFGSCADTTAAFTGAGGHFDPGPSGHSNPVDTNHPYHSGDLTNLVADGAGIARLDYTTTRVTLSHGPLTLFDENGSAVIVHQNEDLASPGVVGASGGARIACGLINPTP